jgi:hypothetical protein
LAGLQAGPLGCGKFKKKPVKRWDRRWNLCAHLNMRHSEGTMRYKHSTIITHQLSWGFHTWSVWLPYVQCHHLSATLQQHIEDQMNLWHQHFTYMSTTVSTNAQGIHPTEPLVITWTEHRICTTQKSTTKRATPGLQ